MALQALLLPVACAIWREDVRAHLKLSEATFTSSKCELDEKRKPKKIENCDEIRFPGIGDKRRN
jgi:hypothetical protein